MEINRKQAGLILCCMAGAKVDYFDKDTKRDLEELKAMLTLYLTSTDDEVVEK